MRNTKMKQLDVDVSPPASFINLTLMKTTLGLVIMMLFRYDILLPNFVALGTIVIKIRIIV